MAKVQIICIYLIKSPSSRIYIGQTWNLNERYKSGVSPSQRLLYRSYQKHGKENHTKQIIHQFIGNVTQQDLDYWERRYIDLYKASGFELLNIREGGGNRGALSQETKELLRQRKNEWIKLNPEKQKTITAAACAANIGKKRSEETKKLQREAAKGRPKSEQHRLNASAAKKGKPSPHKGKHFSAEAVERIRAAVKTRNQKRCPIIQYSMNGEFIKEWSSIKEASETLLIHKATIGGCIRNVPHYKSAGGFLWKYK
jgi:group I intron endonuclease